ncbi:hypothetical protein R3P38DRAFT_3255916 [Favolaschia claudopus]|uniref:Uncharacterized protein n=1 Tax=Favolaschia claudopus TaxID=2862362 RepID=A0AAW0DE54_9AGAR
MTDASETLLSAPLKLPTGCGKVSSIYRLVHISDTDERESDFDDALEDEDASSFNLSEDLDFAELSLPTRIKTSADGGLLSTRSESGAASQAQLVGLARIQHHCTNIRLDAHRRTPKARVEQPWKQRDGAPLAIPIISSYPPQFLVGSLSDAWSGSVPTPAYAVGSHSPGRSVVSTPSLLLHTLSPEWLLQSALHGCYLDVFVQGATASASRPYNDRVGVIRSLPVIKRGQRGSVLVRFGRDICTDKWIPVKNVFPLVTTESDGVVTRDYSKTVFDIPGVSVVVIGRDLGGGQEYVGRTGITVSHGKVDLHNVVVSFPISSICRSDPKAKRGSSITCLYDSTGRKRVVLKRASLVWMDTLSMIMDESDVTQFDSFEANLPAAPPSSPVLLTPCTQRKISNIVNSSANTALNSTPVLAAPASPKNFPCPMYPDFEKDFEDHMNEDIDPARHSPATDFIGLPADLSLHLSAMSDSLDARAEILDKTAENLWSAYASLSRFAKHVSTAEPSEALAHAACHLLFDMEEFGIPNEDVANESSSAAAGSNSNQAIDSDCVVQLTPGVRQDDVHSLPMDLALRDRFTDELRKRVIAGFKDGDIDLETFKDSIYSPVLLCAPENMGNAGSQPATVTAMDEKDDYTYEESTSIGDGAFDERREGSVAVDDVQANVGYEALELQYFELDPSKSDNAREGAGSEAATVYLEDIQPPGEAPHRRLRDSNATHKKNKKNSRAGQDRKITSFFPRQPRRKVKVALNRRLRKKARSAPLTGPRGASIASETKYNPRIHRPEVVGFAPHHLPRVQGSGRHSAGERVSRAHPLRIEDVHIGQFKCAPLVAARSPADKCPVCKLLVSHPVR